MAGARQAQLRRAPVPLSGISRTRMARLAGPRRCKDRCPDTDCRQYRAAVTFPMPYHWTPATPDCPETLTLWPHRPLTAQGFVLFIAVTAAMMALPLLVLLGTPMLWVMLPFPLAAIAGVWIALQRSARDGALLEVLTLTPEELVLVRHNPRAPAQRWQANPYWATVQIYPHATPIPNYLTLKGGGREVELGAFLGPDERRALMQRLTERLSSLRQITPAAP